MHIDEKTQTVRSVVISEEKATVNPRATIRDQVWREFEDLETGRRDNLLVAKVSLLLETRPDLNTDWAVQQILWQQTRAFRVAITVDDNHSHARGRNRLFEGYSRVVSGGVSRRRAETLHLTDLRFWMKQIAKKATESSREVGRSKCLTPSTAALIRSAPRLRD